MNEKKDKETLRKFAINKRDEIANSGLVEEKTRKIIEKIFNSVDFKKARHIGLYHPFKNEIDITSITKIDGKSFYLPRCKDAFGLEYCPFCRCDELEFGKYGIKEPKCECINPEILDLIYVPALMINSKNFRLGYGKGYYDRFFAKYSLKAKKIGIIPIELISDDFREDADDYPLDGVISA